MSLLLSQSRSQVRNTGQESINPLRMASRSRGITAPHCHLPPPCALGRLGGPSPRAGPSVCLDGEWGGCTEWVPHAPFSPSVSTTVSHCGWDLVGAMEDREAPWASDCRTCSHSPELLWAEECRSSPFSAWVSSQARLAEAGCFPQTPAEQSLLSCTVTPHFKDASSFFFFFPFPEPKNAVKLSVTGTSYQTRFTECSDFSVFVLAFYKLASLPEYLIFMILFFVCTWSRGLSEWGIHAIPRDPPLPAGGLGGESRELGSGQLLADFEPPPQGWW